MPLYDTEWYADREPKPQETNTENVLLRTPPIEKPPLEADHC